MKKQMQILLAGVLVVIPFAVTIAVIWWAASKLGACGYEVATFINKKYTDVPPPEQEGLKMLMALVGSLLLIGLIYILGLLTRSYVFRRIVMLMERLFSRVPGVKTVYESVRDLLKLFGPSAGRMGKVVLYRPNGGEATMLGILTNANPTGLASVADADLVAVYLPMAFMIGGPVVYVPREHIQEIDMPAEQALRLAATAEISASSNGAAAERDLAGSAKS